MSDWIKVYVDSLDADDLQGALAETPFALQAMYWAVTTAGKRQNDAFAVSPKKIAGAAARLHIAADDLEAGLRALDPDWLSYDGETVRLRNWEKYQSEYLRKKARAPGEDEDPPEASAPKMKRTRPPVAYPPEAEAIRDRWNELLAAQFRRGVQDTRRTTLDWITTRHEEDGLSWETMRRAVDRYFEEQRRTGNDEAPYKVTNFFGDHFYAEPYLADDWTPPPEQSNGGRRRGRRNPDEATAETGLTSKDDLVI